VFVLDVYVDIINKSFDVLNKVLLALCSRSHW